MRIPTATVLAAFFPIAATAAQGDFDFDQKTAATFTQTLRLDYDGAPGSKPMMFMLSGTGGPTPLTALFGGTDSRSLQVGTDLLPLWILTATSGTGTGNFQFPVPALAAIQGVPLHMQLMTGGGAGPNIIDKISNKIVVVPGAIDTTTELAARLGDGRTPKGPGRGLMAVFPIQGSKGQVMFAGGGLGNILGAVGLKTTEIFDTRTKTIRKGPDMLAERALATSTILKDGRVLVAGGVDALGDPTDTCEIYNPTTNTWTATGTMGSKRAGHAAALLNDGRVLVVAGTRALRDIASAITGILRSAEIYNPANGTWSNTASIGQSVLGPALTTLANGRVLVSGGARIETFLGIPVRVRSIGNCQLFNPATGRWSSTGSMRQNRSVHSLNTIRLRDGRVLVLGGIVVNIGLIPPPTTFAGAASTARGEYYNPNTGSWTNLPDMASARSGHTVNQLGNGLVVVAGGAAGAIDAATSVASIQLFRPTSNTFVRTFAMKTQRAAHGSALLNDGSVIVFGGTTSSAATTTLQSIELIHQ